MARDRTPPRVRLLRSGLGLVGRAGGAYHRGLIPRRRFFPGDPYMTSLDALKTRLREIDDLQRAGSLLHWDQATYMPPGGAPARGRQLATLSRLAHERFVA